jgi:hypothetical protein
MNLKSLFNNIFHKKKLVENIILILLLVYLIPKSIFIFPSIGIDSSWKISLNLALKEHLNFGSDVAYTFGPLAYLSTGLREYASSINIVLFWLLSVSSSAFFIRFLLKNSKSYIHLLIISFILFFQGEILFSRDVVIIYLLFLFFTFYYINYRHKLALIIVSLYAILSFYIKVNTGLIINFLFIVFLVYMIIELPKKWIFYMMFGIVHFCVIIALSIPLNTNVINYIKYSMSIINSYNDAMFLESHIVPLQLALISIIGLLFCLLFYFKKITTSRYELYLVGSILLFVFILFKQSFVRADDHFFLYFNLISFVVLIVYHFTKINSSKPIYFGILILTVLCTIKVYRFKTPWIQKEFSASECIEMRRLPKSILTKIGNKSVDLLGSESSYIYFNNLKYNPRPMFQSYGAYNANLSRLNCNKYNSTTSPDFVLYHFGSIDNRHPFWDESMLYFNMLDHYKLVDSLPKQYMGGMLLFEKTQIISNKKTKTSIKKTISLNEEIPIPKSSNILFLTCTINNSFLGSIKRILFQPSTLYVKLKDSENHYYFYKVIAPIMESGVIINKRVHCFKDAMLFFKFNGKKNKSIQSFKLIGDKKWFDPMIKIQFVEYTSCKKQLKNKK